MNIEKGFVIREEEKCVLRIYKNKKLKLLCTHSDGGLHVHYTRTMSMFLVQQTLTFTFFSSITFITNFMFFSFKNKSINQTFFEFPKQNHYSETEPLFSLHLYFEIQIHFSYFSPNPNSANNLLLHL